jgi:hypothetical protein
MTDENAGKPLGTVVFRVGPPLPRTPDHTVEMYEPHHLAQPTDAIDMPPVGTDGPAGPEWAVQDHQAQSEPQPDPPGVAGPLSHREEP